MKDEKSKVKRAFILHPSAFILPLTPSLDLDNRFNLAAAIEASRHKVAV